MGQRSDRLPEILVSEQVGGGTLTPIVEGSIDARDAGCHSAALDMSEESIADERFDHTVWSEDSMAKICIPTGVVNDDSRGEPPLFRLSC